MTDPDTFLDVSLSHTDGLAVAQAVAVWDEH
jgi:hypothetical protein